MKKTKFNLKIFMKRGYHPYMSATYINGYVKDVPLRNLHDEQILGLFKQMYTSMGRKALKHSQEEVSKDIISIQGKWHDDLFNKYPKHELEVRKKIPEFDLSLYPNIPKTPPKKLPRQIYISKLKKSVSIHGMT